MLRIFLNGRAILPAIAALFALLASAPAWALTTGQLRLTVVDKADELAVPNVTVVLTSDVLIGGAQERQTDQNGQILFVELPPGKYDLDLTTQSGGGASVEGIQVNINVTTNYEVAIDTAAIEEVVVQAKQKSVDTESTSRGTILTKDFLNKVPAGRDYQSAVSLAAGVTGQGGNPNMGGSAFNENTYMLDGANITDPVTGTFSLNFNFDAIQQIEVLLGGYMPEYGTSIGGIVNIVTESGTNNLQFQANAFYNNGNFYPRYDERLSADSINIAPTDFDSQFELITISSKISGPIVRDKAWFIISYQSARSVIANIGVPQARDYEGHYVLTKLTWQPTPEHRFTAFMQTDPTAIDNTDQSSAFIKADSQGRQAQGGFVLNGRWQWFLSPEVNLDTALLTQKSFIESSGVPCTHDRTRDWNPCKPGETDGYIDYETPGHIGVGGAYNSVNYGIFNFDDRYRFNASTRLSVLSIDDPFGGTHDMKFGAEGSQLVWDQVFGYSGNTLYVDINEVGYDPQTFKNYYWQEITGPIKFRTTAAEYNVFAQDSWKPVSNLTINYGSRLDSFVVRNDIGEPVLTGTLLGPRLFGAWDPWGDQKTKIATGFGRFNDTGRLGVASYVSTNSFGSKLFLGELFSDGAGGGFLNSQQMAYYNTPKDNLAIAYEDIRSPRVDELILILERELVEDLAVYSSMSGKFTRFGYEQDDRNLVFDSDGSAVIGSRLADPNTFYGRLRTPLLAKRDYFQWDLGLRKVEARRWAAEAVYTYTQSIGSSSQALSGAFAVDPQTQFNYGPLNTDLTHVFKAAAFWDIPTDPWTQTVGFVFQYYDGYPDERLYSADNEIDFGSVRFAPRGKYLRFNPYWFLSLNFTQAIDVRKGVIELTFQAHNVFNNHSPQFGSGGYVDAQNRMVTVARQEPLRLEFGVGYEF